ncbi:MAG: helix-turn-helix domain-containing protein [Oscillospiraceae bacterium]
MLENLKKLREKTGTTQRQLAEAIGVSQQSVNKYENHNINLILKHLSASLTTLRCRSMLSSVMRRTMVNSLRASACLLQKYRRLTPKRRAAVDALLDCF